MRGTVAHPPSPRQALRARPPAAGNPAGGRAISAPPEDRNRFVAPRCTSRRPGRSTIGRAGSNRRRSGAGAAGELAVGNVRVTLPEELHDLVRDVVADLESATGSLAAGSPEPRARAPRRERRRAPQATIIRLPGPEGAPAVRRRRCHLHPRRPPRHGSPTPCRSRRPPPGGGLSWPASGSRRPSPPWLCRRAPAGSRWPAGAPRLSTPPGSPGCCAWRSPRSRWPRRPCRRHPPGCSPRSGRRLLRSRPGRHRAGADQGAVSLAGRATETGTAPVGMVPAEGAAPPVPATESSEPPAPVTETAPPPAAELTIAPLAAPGRAPRAPGHPAPQVGPSAAPARPTWRGVAGHVVNLR